MDLFVGLAVGVLLVVTGPRLLRKAGSIIAATIEVFSGAETIEMTPNLKRLIEHGSTETLQSTTVVISNKNPILPETIDEQLTRDEECDMVPLRVARK